MEGNWNTNPQSKQSIRPILDILYYSAGIRYVYRKCNTKDEFFEYLRQFTFKRYKNYRILYIAFHGRPNGIQIGRDFVTLSEIADVWEGHLSGRIVHFGSCSTHADETREYRRFYKPHESKHPFGLSETSGFYRVHGVGNGVAEIVIPLFSIIYFNDNLIK